MVNHSIHSIATLWMWGGFIILMLLILAVNLYVLGGAKPKRLSVKQAILWSIFWMCFSLLFNFSLWIYLLHTQPVAIAHQKALEFLSGYLVEQSLSIDNLFVFLVIFHYFAVPIELQRRVLLYGIIGAIFLRLIMILAGIGLISKFHWILYVLGVFLVISGAKILFLMEQEQDLDKNIILIWLKKHIRVINEYHGEKFFIYKDKLLYATPLLLTLIMIELSDLIFAIDSVPAVFGITEDPFIVFTSNIFAILGLRSLFFLLAEMAAKFQYLKIGVAVLLIVIGCKMILGYWFRVPVVVTLLLILGILVTSIIASILKKSQSASG